MTTFITKANQGAYQTAALSTNGLDLLDQEEVVIAADATISSEKATGIAGSANVSGASILIMGTVLSGGLTTFFFKQAGILAKLGGNTVQIGATGVVFGQSDGILLSDASSTAGSNFVENRGLVTTASGIGISAKLSDNHLANLGTVEAVRGIVAGSMGSSNNKVVNSGSIFSSGIGVELWGNGSSLTNSGLIRSIGPSTQLAQAAVELKSISGETITVLNTGTIEGNSFYAIIGGAGADRVINQGTISGGINLGAGNNYYDGRGGSHIGYIKSNSSNDPGYILFGNGNDTAYGSNGRDTFVGLDGNDFLSGEGGSDFFDLGGGDDVAIGGSGDDSFDLGLPGFGNDTIDGGSGIDSVTLAKNIALDAVIDLRSTKLQLVGAQWGSVQLSGIERVTSGKGDDLLIGSNASNELIANEGLDTLEGGLGNDVLDGGDGFDFARFTGSVGAKVNLTSSAPQVTGYGTDTFKGIDALIGGTGADNFIGDGSFNTLVGNAGNDTLSGGAGSDTFYSGIGNDKLTGGAQSDNFFFDTALNAKTNVDTIADFTHADDIIHLENAVFKKLTKLGTLNKSFFVTGTKAKDTNDYLVYDKATGALFYDADGSGAGAAVKFAQLKKGASLAYDDFFVY